MASEMELGEEVGDSSTNLLANYQRHARELLRSALLEQHGALSTTEKGVPELKRWALIKKISVYSFSGIKFASIGGRRNC